MSRLCFSPRSFVPSSFPHLLSILQSTLSSSHHQGSLHSAFFYSSILKSLSLEGFTSLVGYDQTATSSFPFHHSFLQFCCCPFTSCSAFCLCYYIQSLLFPPLVFVSFSLKEKKYKEWDRSMKRKTLQKKAIIKVKPSFHARNIQKILLSCFL